MMTRLSLAFAALLGLLSVTPSARAELLEYTGTFDVTLQPFYNATSFTPTTLTGTFTFEFDNASASAADNGNGFFQVTLSSLTMTNLGFTTFTPANVGLDIFYEAGQFNGAVLGGLPNVGGVEPGTDNFWVSYAGMNLDGATFYDATASAITDGDALADNTPPSSGLIIADVVPEPSSVFLLGLGLIGSAIARLCGVEICFWSRTSRCRQTANG